MKVTLKSLQQQSFQIEIDPEESVKALKLKIQVEKGKDYAAEHQRLIYAGKILLDDNKLSSYNIDEKKFIVIMVTKPKAAETTVPSASVSENVEGASTESGDAGNKSASEKPPVANSAEVESVAKPPEATCEPSRSAVQCMVDMGYDRTLAEQALRATSNDIPTAVEFLVDSGEPGAEDPLGFLRDQPQFQQMRAVIQKNPSLLNAVLQQIGQTNPALLQAINQNQQAFVRMLNEPVTPSSGASSVEANASEATQQQPTHNVIPVSPQDKEAIERLKALGFSEHLVIQAYFACEKNENLAADFLFSLTDDD